MNWGATRPGRLHFHNTNGFYRLIWRLCRAGIAEFLSCPCHSFHLGLKKIHQGPTYRVTRSTLEPLMFFFDLALLGTLWYMLQSLTGLLQYVAYVFGFLLGSWIIDQYFSTHKNIP